MSLAISLGRPQLARPKLALITTINRVNLTTMTRLIALLVAVAANEISSSPARARVRKPRINLRVHLASARRARRPRPPRL